MTSRLRVSRDYPHPVGAFAAALADPDFHRARLGRPGAQDRGEVVSHRVEGDRVDVTVRQPVPAGAVPAPVTAFLADALVFTRTERWRLGAERLEGAVEVVVPGAPVRAGGSMSVAPADGGGCRLAVDVDVTVRVPLAGALVEPGVVSGIRALTGEEHECISEWLAAHP